MKRVQILIGTFMMFFGILLLLAGTGSIFLFTGFGSCLIMILLLCGMLLTVTGIIIPKRRIG